MYGHDDFAPLATMADAHREWHLNAGVPMGTPGCPQDACHPVEEPVLEEVRSDAFTWNGINGVACASDLGWKAGYLPDGVEVTSTKTGAKQMFFFDTQDVVEGDLISTGYATTGATFRLTIFND